MFSRLLLVFTIVPLVELALLIWIGNKTSLVFTIGLLLVSGILGAALARWQGWLTVFRIQSELRAGRMPTDAVLDGLLILVAAALLVTPGVLTDAVGFLLLVPAVRRLVKRRVAVKLRQHFRIQAANFAAFRAARPAGDRIIDAEVLETRVEDAE